MTAVWGLPAVGGASPLTATAAQVGDTLAGLAIIVTLARLLGALFRRIGQPPVVLLTELDAPLVVRLYEYVEDPSRGAAIVMELVNGASLHDMISRQGPAGPESALAVLKGSLLGLAAAHAMNVVHRDYKPENVLVDAAGDSKLADFGVAVRAGRRVPSAGTPRHRHPGARPPLEAPASRHTGHDLPSCHASADHSVITASWLKEKCNPTFASFISSSPASARGSAGSKAAMPLPRTPEPRPSRP
jgi:serine/threonine protein kinase